MIEDELRDAKLEVAALRATLKDVRGSLAVCRQVNSAFAKQNEKLNGERLQWVFDREQRKEA